MISQHITHTGKEYDKCFGVGFPEAGNIFHAEVQTVIIFCMSLVCCIVFTAIVNHEIIIGPSAGIGVSEVKSCLPVCKETLHHQGNCIFRREAGRYFSRII